MIVLTGVGLCALALGYHLTVPATLATAPSDRRQLWAARWAVVSAPLLATTALVVLATFRATRIDGLALPDPLALRTAGALSLVLFGGLLLADLAVLVSWRRWTTTGWWLDVVLAAIVVIGLCYVASWMDQERHIAMTLGQADPAASPVEPSKLEPSLYRRAARTAAFTLLVLGAGTLLTSDGTTDRWLRRSAAVTAPASPLLLASLPAERLSLLLADGLQWTAAAAAALLLLQLWLRPKPALLCRIVATSFGSLVAARLLSTLG